MDQSAYLREKVRGQCNYIARNKVIDAGLQTMIVRRRAENTYVAPSAATAGELSIGLCDLSRRSYSSSYVTPIKPPSRSCSCDFNPLGAAGKIAICCCGLKNIALFFNYTEFNDTLPLTLLRSRENPYPPSVETELDDIAVPPLFNAGRLQLCSYDIIELFPLATAVYYKTQVMISQFRCVFNVQFNAVLADGIAFVIQNEASDSLGGDGGGNGYLGINPGIAVLLDTYSGGNNFQLSTQFTQTTNYVETGSSGIINDLLGLTNTGDPGFGGPWNLNVDIQYDGNVLAYTIRNNDNEAKSYSTSLAVDITAILGSKMGWIGFTGGTGELAQDAFITSWAFYN